MNSMKPCAILTLAVVMTLGAGAQAYEGEEVLGPGLGSPPQTPYHQDWNRTLSPDTLYTLTGLYYVTDGHQITIPAGTHLVGEPAATLVVQPGAQVFAEGEVDNPIVFGSNQMPGNRNPGDWGGVVLLGYAPVNQDSPVIEGGIIEGTYGGDDPNDSSGIFKYVRIEFPGYRFQLNNEINGLTMGGVGAGTELHHIQVSYSFDDSYEWFGGTVNAHHLVAFGGTDDDFDADFGWQGKVQFGFVVRDPEIWDPNGSSNGFESDNEGDELSQATPRTWPVFSNMTLVGPERTDAMVGSLPEGHKFRNCAVLRRSTRCSIFNSVLTGYPRGFSIRDPFTIVDAQTDVLRVHDVSVTATYEYEAGCVHDTGRWEDVCSWFDQHGNIGVGVRMPSEVMLTDLSVLNAPNAVPAPGSELIGSADFSDDYLADAFFTPVTYRGAFDPDLDLSGQWTAGWTNFDPQGTLVAVAGEEDTPAHTAYVHNYPNPFNPSTTIQFAIPAAGHVRLQVFDVAGRVVATLQNGELDAGVFQTTFNGEGLSSGTYFYRLVGNGFTATEKMQLIK